MKKIIVPLLICTMLFSFAACGKETVNSSYIPSIETTDEGSDGPVVNPWTTFKTLEDAKTDSGLNFMLPDEFKSDDTVYRSMSGQMLEVKFQTSDTGVTIRSAKATSGDISGDYNKYSYEVTERCRDIEINVSSSDSAVVKKVTWSDGVLSYVVIFDSEVAHDDAINLIQAVILENSEAY